MFVAVCDQLLGTSTSSWRKIVTPFSFPINAVRFSHSTASKGDFFPSAKYRWKLRHLPAAPTPISTDLSAEGEFPRRLDITPAKARSAPAPPIPAPAARRESRYYRPICAAV